MVEINKHRISGSYDALSNRMKDEVTMLEEALKMNVQFKRFPTNINLFFYSFLRAVFKIEFEYKIKIKH